MGNHSSKPVPQRSNSIPVYHNGVPDISYHTHRGNVPARIVYDHVEQAPKELGKKGRYPKLYKNSDEDANGSFIFSPEETRERNLWEVPVNTNNFQFHRRNAGPERIEAWENPTPKKRREIWHGEADVERRLHCYNTPGEYRAIVRQDPEAHRTVLGVVAHPQGNMYDFDGAMMQPMEREDRQDVIRHLDRNQRSGTWPERGRDGDDYYGMEQRRPPRPDQYRR